MVCIEDLIQTFFQIQNYVNKMPEVLPPLDYPTKPSLKYINRNYGPAPVKQLESLQHLGQIFIKILEKYAVNPH